MLASRACDATCLTEKEQCGVSKLRLLEGHTSHWSHAKCFTCLAMVRCTGRRRQPIQNSNAMSGGIVVSGAPGALRAQGHLLRQESVSVLGPGRAPQPDKRVLLKWNIACCSGTWPQQRWSAAQVCCCHGGQARAACGSRGRELGHARRAMGYAGQCCVHVPARPGQHIEGHPGRSQRDARRGRRRAPERVLHDHENRGRMPAAVRQVLRRAAQRPGARHLWLACTA